jgi:prepilin-type processing-associated H-X9-DG protein
LLTVIGIIGILAGLALPGLVRAKAMAGSIRCLSNLRQIGLATRLYADDHSDELPRSQHSAFAHGQLAWGRAIAPGLGGSDLSWTQLLSGVYHCPADRRTEPWSYGWNVYLEVGPDDDYEGKPATWHRLSQIPTPTATVAHAETSTGADHVMAHFWVSLADTTEVASKRHLQRSNYGFIDGHSESKPLEMTYQPSIPRDLWNPSMAR